MVTTSEGVPLGHSLRRSHALALAPFRRGEGQVLQVKQQCCYSTPQEPMSLLRRTFCVHILSWSLTCAIATLCCFRHGTACPVSPVLIIRGASLISFLSRHFLCFLGQSWALIVSENCTGSLACYRRVQQRSSYYEHPDSSKFDNSQMLDHVKCNHRPLRRRSDHVLLLTLYVTWSACYSERISCRLAMYMMLMFGSLATGAQR